MNGGLRGREVQPLRYVAEGNWRSGTRRTVMDLARKRGIKVSEREIWPEELESFEQMFLAGTAVEITPVQSVGPWKFEVGDITRQLMKDYDDLVNGRIPNA